MGSVTESRMAIAMARRAHGLSTQPYGRRTVKEVAAVFKRLNPAFVYNRSPCGPTKRWRIAKRAGNAIGFTGFSCGDEAGRVVGIVTKRDMRFALTMRRLYG